MTIAKNPVQTLVRVKGNLEAIGGELKDNTGAVVDLTGKTVVFRMVNLSTSLVKINDAAATLDDAVNGKVSYSPSSGDFDTAGEFAAYFIDTTGVDVRWPYDGSKFRIRVVEETDQFDGF